MYLRLLFCNILGKKCKKKKENKLAKKIVVPLLIDQKYLYIFVLKKPQILAWK